MMLMVSSKGILVNKEQMSKLARKRESSCCILNSAAKTSELLTVLSFTVMGWSHGTSNFASPWTGDDTADMIGLIGVSFLWTLGRP